ncbi:hypothetical protein HYU16_04585 [Candidatus Woesearchaeota archaeon]|nr:hypothetical protein [Candidatus Woesearchaeota archaeon]
MDLEGKINGSRYGLMKVATNIATLAAVGCALAGFGFLVHFSAGINKEDTRQAVVIEGTGQRIEYLARTPRKGSLRLVPWNDDNGHAIMRAYDSSGVEVLKGVDEDYNGSFSDEGDKLTIRVDGKTVKCFFDRGVNSKGEEFAFVASDDPITNAMVEGARGYCSTKVASANSLYLQTRQQLNH